MEWLKGSFRGNSIAILFFLTFVVMVIYFFRLQFYNYERVDKHHEKYTVSEIHSCYDGKYKICDISIKSRSGDTTRLEVEFLVEEMQTVYKHCWYRGIERTGRWCYGTVRETLSAEHSVDYKDM